MSNSELSDVKGNCSNEFGDHIDSQDHGLVNNQNILDLHQSNDDQSLDGANRFLLGTPTDDGVPLPSMNNQLQTLGEPESAVIVIDVEKETVPEPPRKRMADREKEIDGELKRLKKESTSLENANVSFKNQCARLEKSVKSNKEIAAYWKDKYNEQTNKVALLSTAILDESQLLRQRIVQLEARNELLENARDQVNNKESEQGTGSSQN